MVQHPHAWGCTTEPQPNACFYGQWYSPSIADEDLDSTLRNFVLPSAHGCAVDRASDSVHRRFPCTVRLTCNGILSARPSILQRE